SSPIFTSEITTIKFKGMPLEKARRKAVARDSFFKGVNAPGESPMGVEAERTSQLIDMLNLKRIDLVIADSLVATDILIRGRPHMLSELEFGKPPLERRAIHLAFSRKWKPAKALLQKFDQTLNQLKASRDYDAMLARYGFEEPKAQRPSELHIGIPDNRDMRILESLRSEFEKNNLGTKLIFHRMPETFLRRRNLISFVLDDRHFDVVSLGPPELSKYAKSGWIQAVRPMGSEYDVADILPRVKESLTFQDQLFAMPFYSETLMTYYRKDLFKKHSLWMPTSPTYAQILSYAKKLHDPKNGVYGICLRGKSSSKMVLIATFISTFGARFFDQKWEPQFTDPEFKEALSLYIELTKNYGPPDVGAKTYSDNLKLFAQGHCAMWIDATAAASSVFDPVMSTVHDKIGFAEAPIKDKWEGSRWTNTWAFAVVSSSSKKALALKFLQWSTSKEYINLVAQKKGWLSVPPGTRRSTYNQAYIKDAPFGLFVLERIQSFKPSRPTIPTIPYRTAKPANIPEWSAIISNLDSRISDVILGKDTLDNALGTAQRETWQVLYQAGYYREVPRG
ncbi:MAG: extracellular solute-binding protein, partial [Proteobacteria bacterium]